MKYYVKSVVDYVTKQLESAGTLPKNGKRYQIMIDSLPPAVVFRLADALEELCHRKQIKLELKVASELSGTWEEQWQSDLKLKGYACQGSLTGLRNTVGAGSQTILQVLIGSAYVTDNGSLADFHQCDQTNIWELAMGHSCESWLGDLFDKQGIDCSPETMKLGDGALTELADRFNILKISDALEKFQPTRYEAVEVLAEFMTNLDDFGLPNLTGYCQARKQRPFRYYVDSAFAFISYQPFMETQKREKALKQLSAFRQDAGQVIPEEKLGTFGSKEELLDDLEQYITNRDKGCLGRLKICDFLFVWENILGFRPPKESKDKLTLRKLSGAPLEVLLRAIYLALQKSSKPSLVTAITLTGKTFKHDYPDSNNETPEAQDALTRLLGGFDTILPEHIDVPRGEDGKKIAVTANLLNEEIRYVSAKTGEPYFEFWIEVAEGDTLQEHHFALKLPEIHPYRLGCSLLSLADAALSANAMPMTPPLPVYHLNYYREVLVAKDEEEICRVLLHCINESRPGGPEFMENIFTRSWHAHAVPLQPYYHQLSDCYHTFVHIANTQGLYAALFKAASPLTEAFHQASMAYVIDAECARHLKLSAMLMRAFLVVEAKKSKIDAWVVEPFEGSAIITILHPSVIEMLQAQAVFMLTAFSNLVKTELASAKVAFKENKWQYFVDMATIQMPLGGLLVDIDGKMSIGVRGRDLIHRIGLPKPSHDSVSTRLLTRYDYLDDEEISDEEIFKDTRESKFLLRILHDYLVMHPHAQDGITLAVYRNDDIQPVLAALNVFLKQLYDEKVISRERRRKYAVNLVLFSESSGDTGINNWLEVWQEHWEAAETSEKLEHYSFCQLSVSHRIVTNADERKQFARILDNELDCDIMLFYNFIEAGQHGNKFKPAEQYDSTQDTLKFPILEKAFCSNQDPDEVLTRSQIANNRQFKINAAHTEIMARLKTDTPLLNQYHVILGSGDYAPWQRIVEAAHQAAEWVVCVDANVDDKLLAEREENQRSDKRRELIGFGSGVGVHGESNFTISTQKFAFADLKLILRNSFRSIYKYGNEEEYAMIVDTLIQSAVSLSGLSLIRALGPSYYICDFLSYSLMQRILPMAAQQHLCNQLFSIDAYRHWFDIGSADDKSHPDLLWLRADITESGIFAIDAKIIECKMRSENPAALNEARGQIQNGLDILTKIFVLKQDGVEVPDGRYWYLQLHRLIASSAKMENIHDQKCFLSAMERLTAGQFTITWGATIFAFWTDSQKATLDCEESYVLSSNGHQFEVPVYTIGYKFIRHLCQCQETPILSWQGLNVVFSVQETDSLPVEEHDLPPAMEEESPGDTIALPEPGPSAPAQSEPVRPEEPTPPWICPVDMCLEGSTDMAADDQVVSLPDDAGPTILSPIPARIYLGKEGDRDYYWEFGHEKMSNRHLLIFGNSGMGKTYAIQAILCEFARQQQNSLIIDYTNGFLSNQLDQKTKDFLNPSQHVVKNNKLPVNPFLKVVQETEGVLVSDTDNDVAKRVTAIIDSVYNMGDQQRAILIDAIVDGLKKKKEEFVLDDILETLRGFLADDFHQKSSVRTLTAKLKSFIDEQPFVRGQNPSWDCLFTDSVNRCHVFQMTRVDRETARILTEFVLWDLYAYMSYTGSVKFPKVVVLDEAQNLDHRLDSPLGKILTEGRKFGFSVIAATQTLSNLKKDEQARLFQAGHKLFFHPADTELSQYAELVMQAAGRESKEYWGRALSALNKGECLSIGPVFNEQTGEVRSGVHKIKIAALSDRGF